VTEVKAIRTHDGGFLTGWSVLRRINKPLYKRVLWDGPPAADPPRPAGSFALSPSPARIRGTLASIVDQPDELRELRTFHRALADVNRLRIVRRLAETPSTVTELIDHVGLSQPLVSHHVKRLRDAGLVVTRRAGRETICSLRPGAFDEVAARERDVLGYAPPVVG
jgi:DNA-binding transcriptional ArsR family regulator